MNWEEIVERHAKDYKDYLNGYKQSLQKLDSEKVQLMQHMKCNNEAELPEPMRAILNSNRDAWQNEWGMYGNKFKNMRMTHQKDINKYFRHQELSQDLSEAREKKPEKDRTGGRS